MIDPKKTLVSVADREDAKALIADRKAPKIEARKTPGKGSRP